MARESILRETYLLVDPHDDYAVEILRYLALQHGLRPVCIFTDRKMTHYRQTMFPLLGTDAVQERVFAQPTQFKALCAWLQRRYRIVGVVPFIEPTVELCAALLENLDHLEQQWLPASTLRLFRDKWAWAQHLRARAPGLRLPRSDSFPNGFNSAAPSENAEQIRLSGRFILKPGLGYGNRQIGTFPPGTPLSQLYSHIQHSPHEPWIIQEYVEGRELAINGQVSHQGDVRVLTITEYFRTTANGRTDVYERELSLPRTDPLWEGLVQYASEVIRASGLRSSPFHMEVKRDARGPCLIDLGARVVGNALALTLSQLHPALPGILETAAHGYVFRDDFGFQTPVDWRYYDAHTFARVSGIATEKALVVTLDGIREVEQLPEFVRWSVKPYLGQWLQPTEDLATLPWEVDLIGTGSREDLLLLANEIRERLVWNKRPPRGVERASAAFAFVKERATPKLSWWWAQQRGPRDRQNVSFEWDPAVHHAIHGNNRIWQTAFWDEWLVTPSFELVTSQFSNMKFLSSAQNVAHNLDIEDLDAIERYYAVRNRPASLFLETPLWDALFPWLKTHGYREDPQEEEIWWMRSLSQVEASWTDSPLQRLVPCTEDSSFSDYLALACDAFRAPGFDYRPWADQLARKRRTWSRTEDSGVVHFIAFTNNEPVGVCALGTDGPRAYLFNTAVLPRWRRRGVHSAMVAARLREAAQRGCAVAYFQTDADNGASIATGRKLGFHPAFRRRLAFRGVTSRFRWP